MPAFDRLVEIADREVCGCRDRLPAPLIEHARALPVSYESAPNDDIIDEGFEPDLLGLFVGGAYADDAGHDSVPLPSQILLFLDNIWEYAEGSERVFRREVRKTYLHELGHYLGLDEEDLYERGMD